MNSCKSHPENLASHFDFIIIGSGLAGLSLTLALLNNAPTAKKKILLLEKNLHTYPNRTWCFWEKDSNWWQILVEKEWSFAEFFEGKKRLQTDLPPYTYKMIRSDKFREYAFSVIATHQNVSFQNTEVITCIDEGNAVILKTPEEEYTATFAFDSRFNLQKLRHYQGHVLYQQFVGWFVRASQAVFDKEKARLMDFRVPQEKHVSFCYILPQTPYEALVEFTIFSKVTYANDHLEKLLALYLKNHFPGVDFIIEKKEKGIIPMTDYPFMACSKRIIPIGTAGGCSKASSGYTFSFVQQHTKQLIDQLNQGKPLLPFHHVVPRRFAFYDRVLLRILKKHPEKAVSIFYQLFAKNSTAIVFAFLLNRSTLIQEIKIFSKLPISLFLRMAWQELRQKP